MNRMSLEALRRSSVTTTMTAKIASLALNFVLGAVLARELSPPDLGVFFLASAIASVLVNLSALGLEQSAVRTLATTLTARDLASTRGALYVIVRVAAVSALVVIVVFALPPVRWAAQGTFHMHEIALAMPLVGVLLASDTVRTVLSGCLRGMRRVAASVWIDEPFRFGTALLVLMVLLASGHQLTARWAIAGLAIGSGLAVAASLTFALHRSRHWPQGRSTRSAAILRASTVIMAADLATVGLAQADVWLAGIVLSSNELALYGISARVVLVLSLPLVVLGTAISHLVAERHAAGDRARLELLLRGGASIAFAMTLLVTTVLVICGRPLLGVVFGQRYADAWPILVALSVGQCVKVYTGLCGIALIMTGHARDMTFASLAGLGCIVALGTGGSVVAGPVGLAAGVSVALVVQNVLLLRAARHHLGVATHVSASRSAVRHVLTAA